MDIEDILQSTDDLVFAKTGQHLTDLQVEIIRASSLGLNMPYKLVANKLAYSETHVAQEAAKLWKILSEILGGKVAKNNFKSALKSSINFETKDKHPSHPIPKPTKNHVDIDHIPQLFDRITRTSEIDTLKQWIINQKCHLITIYGIVGIGKTSLAVNLVQKVEKQFDFIIWRDFQQPPTLANLQADLIETFTKHETPQLPSLLDYLRSYRCLLIFDDIQNLFTPQQLAGNYQLQYQNYRLFFQQIIQLLHNSCIIILSQEKLPEFEILERSKNLQNLYLNGLDYDDAKTILQDYGLTDNEHWAKFIEIYAGHPLWLKLIGKTIKDLCNGSVADFLEINDSVFLGDIANHLNRRFMDILSDGEKQVMYLLAKSNEALTINQMANNLKLAKSDLLQICQSLDRRFLIEKREGTKNIMFTLRPVFKAYFK